MKNGKRILLLICAFSFCFTMGVFVGRNTNTGYVELTENTAAAHDTVPADDTNYRLDVNIATKTQLMDLPGIGEVLAERIIEYRNTHGGFASAEDLLNVEGIGQAKFQQIEMFVRVGG